MPTIAVMNPAPPRRDAKGHFLKGGRRTKKRARRPAAKRSGRPKIVGGPHAGKRIVIDLGSRKGLAVAPRGTYKVNPSHKHRKHNPSLSLHKSHHRRRNPIGGIGSFVMDSLAPGLIGAAGAVVVDVGMGYLPLPASLKTGMFLPFVKLGLAVGLGLAAGAMTSRKTGEAVLVGAVAVEVANIAESYIRNNFPTVPLSGMQAYPSISYQESPALAAHVPEPNMGAYAPMSAAVPEAEYRQQMGY